MSEWKKLKNTDMECFACGPENKHGLQMTFYSDGKQIKSNIIIPSHLRGWASLVHGGIISTILDETMSWAAIHFLNKFILTQSMEIEFLKPVYIEEQVSSVAWIEEKISSRKAWLKAEILNKNNEVCARSKGKFVLFTPEKFKKMNIVPPDLLEEMEGMFE
jgi:acyl-coenzyme A thioesterase PaaI-like protein